MRVIDHFLKPVRHASVFNVVPALKAHRLEPVFQVTQDYVKTIIEKDKGQNDLIKDLLKRHGDLIIAIRTNPDSDYQTLAHKVAISEATAKRPIQKLKRAGILQSKGSRKTGYWEVVEP